MRFEMLGDLKRKTDQIDPMSRLVCLEFVRVVVKEEYQDRDPEEGFIVVCEDWS